MEKDNTHVQCEIATSPETLTFVNSCVNPFSNVFFFKCYILNQSDQKTEAKQLCKVAENGIS